MSRLICKIFGHRPQWYHVSKGKVTVTVDQPCDRCGKMVKHELY